MGADLAPQRGRLPELDTDHGPRLRAPARLQHHTQHSVDAEPGVTEARRRTISLKSPSGERHLFKTETTVHSASARLGYKERTRVIDDKAASTNVVQGGRQRCESD